LEYHNNNNNNNNKEVLCSIYRSISPFIEQKFKMESTIRMNFYSIGSAKQRRRLLKGQVKSTKQKDETIS
jgi:hypothetical protein